MVHRSSLGNGLESHQKFKRVDAWRADLKSQIVAVSGFCFEHDNNNNKDCLLKNPEFLTAF